MRLLLPLLLSLCCSCAAESASPFAVREQSVAIDPCSASVNSGYQAGRLVLSLHDFWTVPGISTLLPAGLRGPVVSLTPAQRGRRLQELVRVANHRAEPVTVNVPGNCTYDFSSGTSVDDATWSKPLWSHPDADALTAPMMPKLVLNSTASVELQGDPAASEETRPLLQYSGPGYDGIGHGRVLIAIPSGRSTVVRGVRLQGDHDWSQRSNTNYFRHENSDGLFYTGPGQDGRDRRGWYGAMMIGLAGGANDALVDGVSISGINRAGIGLVGGAEIKNSSFVGFLPAVTPGTIDADLLNVEVILGNTFPGIGYGFNSAISQQGQYNAVSVHGNVFTRVLEGVNGGGLGAAHWWSVHNNTFDLIGDHGVYILGDVWTSEFLSNSFNRMRGVAIKLGANCERLMPTGTSRTIEPWEVVAEPVVGTFPAEGPCGARHVTVASNTFRQLRRGAVMISGTLNTIRNNAITAYSAASDDPLYDPATPLSWPVVAAEVIPDLWLGTDGGQGGYANHVAFNDVIANTKTAGSVEVFITQHPGVADRSIGFNRVIGAGQTVYFNSRLDSRYAPVVGVFGGATLLAGAPTDCFSCTPAVVGDYRQLTDLNPSGSLLEPVAGSIPRLLVRFGASPSVFLMGEDGVHARLGVAGTPLTVHALAATTDLGQDDIYFSQADASGLRLRGIRPGSDSEKLAGLVGAWDYAPQVPLTAIRVRRSGARDLLATAYPGDPSIFGTNLGGSNPSKGSAIYTGTGATLAPRADTLRLMRAADLSSIDEADGVASDELHAAFGNGTILTVFRSGSTWSSGVAYPLSTQLAIMEPARLRRSSSSCSGAEPKQRMYHRFLGSPVVYETAADVGGVPAFGSGHYYYTGTQLCDLAVAADLDGDGRQELNTHFSSPSGTPETVLYYGQHLTCSASTATWNAGTSYSGSGVPLAMKALWIGGRERLVTIFRWSRGIYLSEGLANNGHDLAEWITNKRWANP